MSHEAEHPFAAKVAELAEELGVPGVAAAVHVDGEEHYAYVGVTSVPNPLPVDEDTRFQFGSTGKTFTAVAIMRLVERGDVALDEPVRTYVPELALKDEQVAAEVTVLHLLNHTAGWDGDLFEDQGRGDDALAKYVARMATIEQVSPLGAGVSYNNAALSLAGRVIEKVTDQPFEDAMRELVLEPLGLTSTTYDPDVVMTGRFAVGHNLVDDEPRVARPWALPRGNNPAGGASATARDQLAWVRLHLGDGTAADGSRFLSADTIALMQQPTADMSGNALGDAVGISWLLAEVDGVRTVGHGGTTNGQHSDFVMLPDRRFGFVSMTNCGPNGPELNDALRKWSLEHFLGLREPEPVQLSLSDDELAPYTGRFETIAAVVEITGADGLLSAQVSVKPEMAAALHAEGEDVPEDPPYPLALVEGKPDRYVVASGSGKGMKGFFTRDADGGVDAVNLGGRLATRVVDTGAEESDAPTDVVTSA